MIFFWESPYEQLKYLKYLSLKWCFSVIIPNYTLIKGEARSILNKWIIIRINIKNIKIKSDILWVGINK